MSDKISHERAIEVLTAMRDDQVGCSQIEGLHPDTRAYALERAAALDFLLSADKEKEEMLAEARYIGLGDRRIEKLTDTGEWVGEIYAEQFLTHGHKSPLSVFKALKEATK